MIYFITADRDKGKTTYLQNLIKQQPEHFGGILSIAGPNKESYYAFNVETKETRLLMSCEGNSGITIGKFHCQQETFDWAKAVIENSQKPAIVIDEVGRLELRDEGFAPALKATLKILQNSDKDLYLAVRQQFIKEVLQHFEIREYRVIEVAGI